MAEKEKKLSAEQLKELEVQLRAQLQRAEELKAYYESHPDDPDAFAAFAKNAAKIDTAGMAQVSASGIASFGTTGLTKSTGISVAGASPADMTKSLPLLMSFAFGGPIGMAAAATFQAFRQAGKNRQQNPKLCEAYESVAKEINAHGTDHLPSSPERRAAFVDAYNYATGNNYNRDTSDTDRDSIQAQIAALREDLAANHKEEMDKMDTIADKQTDLSRQIAELSAQLQPCRELASGILDSLPEGDEDSPLAERLYALTSSISAKVLEKQYGSERLPEAGAIRGELKQLFDPIWDRLDPRTQRELFSAKMSYQLLAQKECGNDIDFSGVCTLASKAMEVECEKYFYKRFQQYILEQTPEKRRDAQFVEALSLTPEAEKQSKQRGGFTLGSVQHILKPRYDREKGELEPYKRYMAVLTSYARERLFSPGVGADLMDDRQIQNVLWKYVDYVNTVKNRYRNPSVHKELVSQQSALSCLDYVVDVEKKLKEMVSAFQN